MRRLTPTPISDTMPTISSIRFNRCAVLTPAPIQTPCRPSLPSKAFLPTASPAAAFEDAATIVSCNTQAMQQGEGFSFDGSVNLFALFPVDIPSDAQGAGQGLEGLIGFSGDIAGQDKLRFTVSGRPRGR